jgi:hypothetical protein
VAVVPDVPAALAELVRLEQLELTVLGEMA